MDRWVGKVAVVTGSTSGIGKAIAEVLVNDGLVVVGFARREERNKELAKHLANKKGEFIPVKVDITKEDDIVKGFKWVKDNVGPVHIMINNAGVIQNNSLVGGDAAKWRKVFDTNVIGLCICTREAIDSMRENNIAGHIIHINSISGHKVIRYESNVYGASKFAVTALTEILRMELNSLQSKIKVTSVSPGLVDTEIFDVNNVGSPVTGPSKMPALEAEDVADAVQYALSTPPHVQVHELTIKPIGEIF